MSAVEELGCRSKTARKRQSIIDACLHMNELGVNQGTSGNISLRHEDGMLITPTSVPYEEMEPEQIVHMKLDGSFDPRQRPSSEWRFHLDILRARPEVNAVVHAHPSLCDDPGDHVPGDSAHPLHDRLRSAAIIFAARPMRPSVARELSDYAVKALQDRFACLLAHHGMIAVWTIR